MHAGGNGNQVQATFETTGDYELLFAALDHARHIAKWRSRPAIREVSQRVLDTSPKPFDGSQVPFSVTSEDLDLIEASIRVYAVHSFKTLEFISGARRNLQLHAYDVLDYIHTARSS